uniref:Uracil phosphoribosyltransferase n=1 Tax=Nemalion sp. H.1444 TaxID=1907586 RepID=A0A1G4NWL2_9FLOR|nr:Uracil phosphoribosyltransferase [Nemalion sp. H.1444]
MPINIYSIQHPLVLHWSNCLLNPYLKAVDTTDILHKLGLALIYELTRKSLHTQNLYIKYIDRFNNIQLITNDKICFVCSDLNIMQILGKDVTYIIPNLLNYIVPLFTQNGSWQIAPNNQILPEDIYNYTIIIFERELNSSKASVVIEHLLEKNIPFNHIQLCCIICSNKELEKLNIQYKNIKIYTCIIDEQLTYLKELR